MDHWNHHPGYDVCSDFFDDSAFPTSSTLQNNNNINNHFTNTHNPLYDNGFNTISHDNMSHYPITPSSARYSSRSRAPYPGLSDALVTPHGESFGGRTDMQYLSHAMSMQQQQQQQQHTPTAAMMYGGGHATTMHAPVQAAAPALDFVTYNGSSKSFSDASDKFVAVNTPTPKMRAMPTPNRSPEFESSSSTPQMLPSVPLDQLQFNTFDEAEAEVSGRTPLTVDNDDWMYLEAYKKLHVATIMAAFDVPFRNQPNVALTVTEKLRWVKYQTEQTEKVAKHLVKNPNAKEISAWMLLEALLDAHKFGYKKGFRVSDPSMRCSHRFLQMVKAIGRYAVIRFDLVRMQRLDDLATSPVHTVSRKVANWRGNAGKVKRDEANKVFAAAAGVEYKNVLGDKRKYKPVYTTTATAPEVVADDEDEGYEDMSASSGVDYSSPFDKYLQQQQQGTKRKAGDDDDDNGGDDGYISPSGTPSKRTKLAATATAAAIAAILAGPDMDN